MPGDLYKWKNHFYEMKRDGCQCMKKKGNKKMPTPRHKLIHKFKGQLPPIPISRLGSRMVRCTDKRCKVCPKAEGRRVLFSTVSNTPYTFHEVFTCADTSLIYCIICNKCGKLYIGLTSNSLPLRRGGHIYKWKNHFYEMKGDVGMSLHEKERNKKMPTHTQSHS